MLTQVCIALGSNLGDRSANLAGAIRRLRAEPGIRVIAISSFYETEPVGGPPGQGNYLNAAATIETNRSPEDLLQLMLRIERGFGRVRNVHEGPRTLDLDLLLYGDRVIETPELVVPHPRMTSRAFVLAPLAEIAPDFVHPAMGFRIRELWDHVRSKSSEALPRKFPSAPATSSGQLTGMQVLVTGSTSGIGAAIADLLEQHGASVIRHGRTRGKITADLGDAEGCDRLAHEAWEMSESGLDLLVCNAGADVLTGDAAGWSFERKLETLLSVDLRGTIRLCRTLGEKMKSRGRGSIVTIGWDQAETGMEGDSGQMFAAVKGAVICFTRSLALSLAPEVRVNCVAPGWIRTAWGESAPQEWQERVRCETPLGIWGLPEDIASAVLWLASPAASFVVGQTIRVNGGVVR